ncbi:DUF3349 domain-containing protein [Rhodococcus koreensis]
MREIVDELSAPDAHAHAHAHGKIDRAEIEDYIPLIALLRRRLSDDEVRGITTALVDQCDLPIGKTDIQTMITKVTNEKPSTLTSNGVRAPPGGRRLGPVGPHTPRPGQLTRGPHPGSRWREGEMSVNLRSRGVWRRGDRMRKNGVGTARSSPLSSRWGRPGKVQGPWRPRRRWR